jgi:PAS domain-containing protein
MQDLRLLNAKLQKAIAQLQSANQTLRSARSEICSLDQQLEIMSQEVEVLTREIVRLRDGYSHALDHVPHPALIADEDGRVESWNAAAQQLFGLAPSASARFELSEIPVQNSMQKTLSRKHRAALENGHPMVLKDQHIQVGRTVHKMDVQITSQGLVVFINSSGREGAVGLSVAS